MTRLAALLLASAAAASGGCAALTNPTADGVPVRHVPAEILGRPRADLRPIPLTLLRQPEPDAYLLDKGDVIAVIADGIITEKGPGSVAALQAPVKLPDERSNTAAVGYPFPVDDDGTVSVIGLRSLPVRGLTVKQVEQLIRDEATGLRPGSKELINPAKRDEFRCTVQLLQKRRYQVLVVREDTQPVPFGLGGQQGGVTGGTKKGAGYTVSLQGYENDVLRALNAGGGPPGLDAKNEITILRGVYDPADPSGTNAALMAFKEQAKDKAANRKPSGPKLTRIPLRIYPEQPLAISQEDIILRDGDVVYIEARDTEVYYTAGVMGAGQFQLPRDYDLDVLQALAQVRAPLVNGGFSQNLFVANAVGTGVGAPSPSLCTIVRTLPDGRTYPIRVDVNKAFRDSRERVLIQPGDFLVLQETPGESIARYFSQTLRFNTSVDVIRAGSLNTGLTATNP
jgi:protein involved in polysaccharide export with SLBB domain